MTPTLITDQLPPWAHTPWQRRASSRYRLGSGRPAFLTQQNFQWDFCNAQSEENHVCFSARQRAEKQGSDLQALIPALMLCRPLALPAKGLCCGGEGALGAGEIADGEVCKARAVGVCGTPCASRPRPRCSTHQNPISCLCQGGRGVLGSWEQPGAALPSPPAAQEGSTCRLGKGTTQI